MNRRDLLLNEMGITQWQLRRPEVLKGAINLPISQHIQLIIIASTELDKTQPLLTDILRSINLSNNDCLITTFDFAPHLNVQHSVNYWLLTENQQKIDRTLPYCQQANAIWYSPNLENLKQSPQVKRQFWQQIQTQK
ncbi:DNA polymerase III psi subunit [Bisgaardia hudsonensis]|uniref:DNA polymerase III subunit psi n=1 Tax=Bisgaardia hudsonensis TaxID=109472 RepID=A0A4R2N377_9PAST|nr:DNA polymerase III subunit psi [Bisgaardia hudsonensis]QLB12746.1 DNA polymerase III subunit psi [Bisgaardia hudsonensis]TCP14297.1 DNA polymerase III psi subunit [Bisgaardia hudsonensis]